MTESLTVRQLMNEAFEIGKEQSPEIQKLRQFFPLIYSELEKYWSQFDEREGGKIKQY